MRKAAGWLSEADLILRVAEPIRLREADSPLRKVDLLLRGAGLLLRVAERASY